MRYSTVSPEDDVVFERLGDVTANQFREHASKLQDRMGYLEEPAIELLGLGLKTGSWISKRLFRIGQVQRSVGAPGVPEAPRQPKLTCYELLALNSLLRKGSDWELLELLFCVFDFDEDDRVSLDDLRATLEAFLELPGTSDCLQGDDLVRLKGMRAGKGENNVTAAAKRIAEDALNRHGEPSAPPESTPASNPAASPGAGVGDLSDDDGSSDEGIKSTGGDSAGSTKAAGATPKQQPKRKARRGLCSGKAPKSDDESDAAGEKSSATAKSAKSAKAAKKKKLSGKQQPKATPPAALDFPRWCRWLLTCSGDALPPAIAQKAMASASSLPSVPLADAVAASEGESPGFAGGARHEDPPARRTSSYSTGTASSQPRSRAHSIDYDDSNSD